MKHPSVPRTAAPIDLNTNATHDIVNVKQPFHLLLLQNEVHECLAPQRPWARLWD